MTATKRYNDILVLLWRSLIVPEAGFIVLCTATFGCYSFIVYIFPN